MNKTEAVSIARSLGRKHNVVAYDSQSNFGWCLLIDNRTMVFNPWSLPEPILTAYRAYLARQQKKAKQ